MNRTSVSLIACTAALVAVTGFAHLTGSGDQGSAHPAAAAAQRPVERTSLLCPPPSQSDVAGTTYTSFTPKTPDSGSGGTATLRQEQTDDGLDSGTDSGKSGKSGGKTDGKAGAQGAGKTVLALKDPGTPVQATADGDTAPALAGIADGRFAPGWTTQQTTKVDAGTGRGLQGVSCSGADTDFWFPGASTAQNRTDYLALTNPDDSAAVVDIDLYDKNGLIDSGGSDGSDESDITVGPHASKSVLLSTLTDKAASDLTVHVNVRSGRVAAAIQALDAERGGDWLAASADPAADLVLPGIPKDATDVRLIAFTPADSDADLTMRLASPTGSISPAGHETLHVKGGMTTAVDLGDLTRGEAGSLLLTPTDSSVPVVAALQVFRGKGGAQETAYIPATAPLTDRATAAGDTAKGTSLSVTAPRGAAKVKVTASAGTGGGTEASRTYDIKGGTTQELQLPATGGLKGTYALTVEHVSGGPVYASRTLTATVGGVSGFTVQSLPDDRGTVAVPEAEQDLSVLQK